MNSRKSFDMIRSIFCSAFFILLMASVRAQQNYVLSSDSKLSISGTSTVHDWTVSANSINGSLRASEMSPVAIDFQVDVAQIKSERGATMDKKMHAALQKEEHPQVLFELKEVKGESNLIGTLNIGGNLQNVSIESKMLSSEKAIKITGEYKMALKDFDIEPPTAMFGQVIVGDDITIHFDLIFEGDE